jgi:hypothetical protein
MQKRYALAIAAILGIAGTSYAQAAQTSTSSGTVCGRVDAPSQYILRLALPPRYDNIIIARSAHEELRSTVNVNGAYCFAGLKDHVYTISAFEDGFPQYTATVTPIPGKTVILDLFAQPGVQDLGPAAFPDTFGSKP